MQTSITTSAFFRFWQNITVTPDELALMNANINKVTDRLREVFPWRTAPAGPNPVDPWAGRRRPGDHPVSILIGDLSPVAFPLELVDIELMGSARRETVVRPTSDVDLLVAFQADQLVLTSFSPRSLLLRVSEALRGVGSDLRIWQGEAVTVSFDAGPDIDVFPALHMRSSSVVHFPRRGRMWTMSAPPVFDRKFLESNTARGNRLITVAKYVKVWNYHSGKPFQTFHLEALIERDVVEIDPRSRVSVHNFFRGALPAGPQFLLVGSPDGIYSDLSYYMSGRARAIAMTALAEAAFLSGRALGHEDRGEYQNANACWRELFGERFPVDPEEIPAGAPDAPQSPDGQKVGYAATPTDEPDVADPDDYDAELTERLAHPQEGRSGSVYEIILPPGFVLTYDEANKRGDLTPDNLVLYARQLLTEGRNDDVRILLEQAVPAFREVFGPDDSRTREAQEVLTLATSQ